MKKENSVQGFTDKPWDPSRDRFTDDEWSWSCLVCEDGVCSLPIREPDGVININAVRDAYVHLPMDSPHKIDLERYLIAYHNQDHDYEHPYLNSAAGTQCDVINYEDEYIIERPVVLMKEGVFTGTDGMPRMKIFEVFKNSAHWLEGVPITRNHLPADEEVMPDSPRMGQVRSVKVREDSRDVFGIARFFKNKITPEEYTDIKSGKKLDGSICYRCGVEVYSEPKLFNGVPYVGSEIGEYVFYHYAIVREGACSSSDGCGINQNTKGVTMTDGKQEGAEGTPTPVSNLSVKVELDDEKVEKILNAAQETEKKLNETIATLQASVTELTEKVTVTEKALNEALTTVETLNKERTQKLENAAAEEAAEIEAKKLEGFKMHLNEAAREKASEYFEEYKKVGESWFVDNPDKHMNAAPAGEPMGSQKVVIDNYNSALTEAQEALAKVGRK